MTGRFPMVSLAEVLTKSGESITLNPDELYREVTVRLWGKGVIQRREVTGAGIAATRRLVVRSQQFILSRIDARNGAFGLVPDSLDGAVVSNDFPVFTLNQARILPSFLNWMSKTRTFIDLCKVASEGTTNRVRLVEDRFLATKLPLPPPEEQRRIAARIEELAAKIEEARSLRQQATSEAEALWVSALYAAFRPVGTGKVPNEEQAADLFLKQARAYAHVPKNTYNNAHPWAPNIYSDGPYKLPPSWVWADLGSVLTHLVDCVNDTPDFVDQPTGFIGLKSTNVRPYKLDLSQSWFVIRDDFERWNRRERPQAGDLILTREAPMGNVCVLPNGVQVCLTQRLMLLRADGAFVATPYLVHFLNSPLFQNQVIELCRGLTTPHVRVQDAPFLRVPLAPLTEQRRIAGYLDEVQAHVYALKQSQAETAAELDALLPSILDKAFRGELC